MSISNSISERQTNNFDFLRLLAASFVVCGHSSNVLLNKPLEYDLTGMLTGISMPKTGVMIFFVISGYLVTGSWDRSPKLPGFLVSRIFRIFPAVVVLVLLTVFVLGPIVTGLNVGEYFSSGITFRYLQNMSLYRMYYDLPGVFENNISGNSVNASLWTLPYEFTCYLFIALLGISYLLKERWVVLALFLACFFSLLFFKDVNDKIILPVLGIDFKNFTVLFLYFMSGSVYFLFRKEIPFNFNGLSVAVLFCFVMKIGEINQQFYVFVLPYIVLWFAYSKQIKLNQTGRWGDFSYGLFLYSFPVQQLLLHLFPDTFNLPFFILASFCCTLPLAVMSWHLVEKPVLGWRRKPVP